MILAEALNSGLLWKIRMTEFLHDSSGPDGLLLMEISSSVHLQLVPGVDGPTAVVMVVARCPSEK